MKIAAGLRPDHRDAAAALYWQAFGGKLHRILGPDTRALAFIVAAIDPTHAISATDDDGRLIGIAGFKTHESAFVAGSLATLAATYGWPGALWRASLLSLLNRDTENTRFLTDGLAVVADARSRGVGTALLDALSKEARRRNFSALRLDVVDSNPRAQALYTRLGFTVESSTSIGPLRYLFGFRRSITMIRPV